jgi:phosphonopyruvate decarboxylase
VALLALGLALARPDVHVVALDGDGAALMRMGAFATLGTYGPSNLTHLLLDNGAHESTGGQATVSPNVSFAGVAAACGYPVALEGDDPGLIDALLDAPAVEGPRFARLRIGTGTPKDLPRPTVTPPEVARRLTTHLAERVAEPSAPEPGR